MDVKVICSFILGATVLAMYFCLRLISYQVIEESQDVLVCKLRPTISWAIATFFGGIAVIFIVVGLYVPQVTVLECDRFAPSLGYDRLANKAQSQNIEPDCKLTEIGWRGQELNRVFIHRVQEAKLETKVSNYSKNGSLDRYGVTLVNDDGSFPLTKVFDYQSISDRPKFFKSIEEISSFIHDPLAEHLSLLQDDRDLVPVAIGLTFLLTSLAVLFLSLSPYITFMCDRQSNMATLARHNLFRHKVSTYQISDIASVEVQETSDIESTQYRVIIVLQSGEKVPLTYWFTSGWQEKYSIAHKIQKFLQLKPQMDKS